MVFKRFTMFLALRVALVGLAIAATMWLALKPGYYAATIISIVLLLLVAAELWRFVSRTNREIELGQHRMTGIQQLLPQSIDRDR